MSTPRRGLGRGLGALLGVSPRPAEPLASDVSAPVPEETSASVRTLTSQSDPAPPVSPERNLPSADIVRHIPIEEIRPNPQQPRKHFDPQTLVELESSIRALGVLVPIIVRPLGGSRFELIAGERRWRAAAAARQETIPAIVRSVDDRTSLEYAIVENLQRENLNVLEEAMCFEHLLDEYDFTQEQLSERLGKSRPAIANTLRLLTLSDKIKAEIRKGTLSAGHARALLAFPESRRDGILRRIFSDGLTVREVESLSSEEPRKRKAPTRAVDANLAAIESRLRYRFGASVRIVETARGGQGRLEIRFANQDDLTRILDVLGERG
ncbi:MAG TPA: ParB/RepB/Spo0J family partition protein [Candidatus Baltobacteraceae bacterium]|jgi:ParB family chromosome partitioning protein|nr:ParB/RepB/Spo0J family partition protein [Candidatus Baltobacteraceae bacterium]